ncbi:DUF2514 family protein, partial [Pseudomonas agarici]
MTLFWRVAPYLAALLIAGLTLFGAYRFGGSVSDSQWQARWNERDTGDASAKAVNEAAQRVREQAYQQSINKAIQDGQQIIDKANADAAAARASADSLRGAADKLTARLSASNASGNSCTAAASA